MNSKITPADVNELLRSRRSTFNDQFEEGKKIPDEIIWELLRNANNAPSHKLTEPWRFVVFTGDGLKILGENQAAIYKENAGTSFKQNKYEKLKTGPLKCSHVIAIGLKRHANELPEMEEIASVACAVQNIYNSLQAYGIGGYWTTGGVTFMEAAKPFFGLEPDDKLMGFFQLGYIKVPTAPRTPGPIEEKVTWVNGE